MIDKHISNSCKKELERVCTFNYSKKETLSYKEFVMLFFTSVLFDNTYKTSFNKLFDYLLKDKDIKCYKITFTNNNKLKIDNKLETLTFISFKDLINNYFVINNKYVLRKVNLNTKCFIKVDKHYDITYYNVYLFSNKSFNDLKLLFQLTNFKYKFNFTKKERQLIFKLKNNYYKGRYSYNFNYMEDIQDNIKLLESDLKLLESDLNYYNDLFKLNKKLFFKEFQDLYIETIQEKQDKESYLKELKTLESNLISSKDKITTLQDYFLQDSY